MQIIRDAAREVNAALSPETVDPAWLVEAMTDIGGLLSINATEEALDRWARVAIRHVADLPAAFLDEVLQDVGKHCRFASEVVPHVCEQVEQRTKTMRKHAKVLNRIIAIADGLY